jgi:hypothetical protein
MTLKFVSTLLGKPDRFAAILSPLPGNVTNWLLSVHSERKESRFLAEAR